MAASMAPSYLKICEKVLQQKQLADKRNDLLYKRINFLEKKLIELEAMKNKCEILTRDNEYLELELRELKKSRDAIFFTTLEKKSKVELANQIGTLMSQVSALEKTNTELWIDKRRLSRKLDALKPNPLFYVYGSKEFFSEDNFSSILCNAYNSTCDSVDDSFVVDENLKLQEVVKEVSEPKARDPPSRFCTPIKRPFSSTQITDGTNWLSTPPLAVIPSWCVATVEEDTMPRSMVVSTVFSDYVDHDLSIDSNRSYSTATTYRKIEIHRPKSTTVLSTTFKQIDYDSMPASTVDSSVDKNSTHLSISNEEEE